MSVSVDNDFARFGAKSYAINKITSVEVREKRPANAGCVVAMLGLGAALFLLLAIPLPPLLLGSALFGWLAYAAWKRSKIVEYQLFLITSAAEQQAFVSSDADKVQKLRDHIEAAMARHSKAS